ncbi:MAG: heavy-metal-associated domain-containing protein [Sphingobacteriales bacterium]|nr:MAG: heavy-metal-associated domain-containing protein [Sphingobacteriales bacterium]
MKSFKTSIFNFALAIVLIAGFIVNQPPVQAGGKSETVEILTSAICDMCEERIEKAVYNTKGVKAVNLDLDTKIATVKFNPKKVSADEIRTVISNAGYRADELPANETAYNKLPGCCKAPGACSKSESNNKH